MRKSIELMKRVLFLAAIITSGFSVAAQDAAAVKAAQDAEVKKAIRFLEIEQPSKAIETLNQAIAANPTATRLNYYLGYVQLKTGDRSQALKTFEKGAASNPDEALNHVGLGAIRMVEGKATEAKAFFDKAQTMTKSKDAAVLQAIAEAHLVDAKYAETAIKLLDKAKTLNPNSPKTFMLMAEADLLQNKGGPSITNSEKAARLDPTNGKPWYNIALVYQRSQNFPIAEENFKKAISVDPEFTLAYKELGESYYSMKDGEKAASAYENYLRLKENPNDLEKTRYAFFLFMAKKYAKANEIFKPLAAKPDASPTTIKYYGYSLIMAEDLAEAQKMFEKYFSMVPADKLEASDYKYYGDLLGKLKMDSLAVINYQQSLVLTPNQPDVASLIAENLFKRRKYTEAIAAYEVLASSRPDKKLLSTDLYRLGQAYYYTEQYQKADTTLSKFVELQPKISVGYLWLGRARAYIDPDAKLDFAKAAYDKVIEIASPAPETGTNKKDLIESYRYMANYYGGHRDRLDQVKLYMEKILVLDPNDANAKEALRLIKEGQKQQKPKPK
jgi:tetratricopeptide (TPR) repeat protein